MITALALTAGLLAQQAPTAQTPAPELVIRTFEGGVMGTELKIEAIGTDVVQLDLAIAAAVAELNRVEDLMTAAADLAVPLRVDWALGPNWDEAH